MKERSYKPTYGEPDVSLRIKLRSDQSAVESRLLRLNRRMFDRFNSLARAPQFLLSSDPSKSSCRTNRRALPSCKRRSVQIRGARWRWVPCGYANSQTSLSYATAPHPPSTVEEGTCHLPAKH